MDKDLTEKQTAAAAAKELRARDAAKAMSDYVRGQKAALDRMAKLRALRLERDAREAEKPPEAPAKKVAAKKPAKRVKVAAGAGADEPAE